MDKVMDLGKKDLVIESTMLEIQKLMLSCKASSSKSIGLSSACSSRESSTTGSAGSQRELPIEKQISQETSFKQFTE